MKKGFTTKALHTKYPKADGYGSLHMPVYEGAAFEFESAEQINDSFEGRIMAHAYSRTSNPTVEFFEHKLKSVTGADAVVALSSGMTAISNLLLTVVEKGGNIVSSNHLFGHTYALFKNTFASWGIEVRFVDFFNVTEVEKAIDDKTRALFFETVTNPQLEILDIKEISDYAHSKGLLVVSDTTLTPPYVFNSKDFGVDVEVMSTTKFISGGATSIGGVVIDNGTFDWTKLPALSDKWTDKFGKGAMVARLRKEIFRHLGGCMTAHTAHFQILGLDILSLRVDKCVDNCIKIGEYLQTNSRIKNVNYPGLKNSNSYELAKKQFSGKPGAIITFELDSMEQCFKFYNELQIIRRATNLNDNKSLIIHPFSTIYSEYPEQERLDMGISPNMFRFSVGIEDADDLISDIEQALDKC